ncbi:hypothetical protein HDU96_009077 [Phlyctochytrium bullatum]|nr:hypothetical protein HDU96_009077 [Phlyctochytrium bullatum]
MSSAPSSPEHPPPGAITRGAFRQTCWLLTLPREILTPILVLANDLALAVKLEALHMNLHLRNPRVRSPAKHSRGDTALSDPADVFLGLGLAMFPASKAAAAKCAEDLKNGNESNASNVLTRLVVAWFCTYPSQLRGQWKPLMQALARHNRLPVLRMLHARNWGVFTADLMDEAAAAGHVDVVTFLHTHREEGCTRRAFDEAGKNGHLSVIEFLHTHRVEGGSDTAINDAAKNGHLAIVQFLHDRRQEGATAAAMDAAASNGHLEVLRFLHAHRAEGASVAALDRAYNLDVARFLAENRTEGCTVAAVVRAAERGDVELLRFLCDAIDGGRPAAWACAPPLVIPPGALDAAAAKGRLEAVMFLHAKRPERGGCTVQAMDEAAAGGWLDVVRFLHQKRTEGCTQSAMDSAADNGHLEVVKFLHQHRQEGCTTAALDGAAAAGHLSVVRFLTGHRSEGCTERALDRAAANGHLPVVQHLWEKGARFSRQIVDHAGANGCVDVCAWLLSQTVVDPAASPGDLESGTFSPFAPFRWALFEAATKGDLALLEFILQHPHTTALMDWQRAVTVAAAKGRLAVICRLQRHLADHAQGWAAAAWAAPELYVVDAIDQAAGSGHAEVVRYLFERGTRFSAQATTDAAVRGHLDVLRLLRALDPTVGVLSRALPQAAANGHLDVLKFLFEEGGNGGGCVPGVILTLEAIKAAIASGHTSVVEYLIGVALRSVTWITVPRIREALMLHAAELGMPAMVRMVLERIPEREEPPTSAEEEGALATLVGIGEDQRPRPHPVLAAFAAALAGAANDQPPPPPPPPPAGPTPSTASALPPALAPSDPSPTRLEASLEIAAGRGHLSTVRLLLDSPPRDDKPRPCTFAAVDAAVENGHVHVVRFLLENVVEPEEGRGAPARAAGKRDAWVEQGRGRVRSSGGAGIF